MRFFKNIERKKIIDKIVYNLITTNMSKIKILNKLIIETMIVTVAKYTALTLAPKIIKSIPANSIKKWIDKVAVIIWQTSKREETLENQLVKAEQEVSSIKKRIKDIKEADKKRDEVYLKGLDLVNKAFKIFK